MPIPTPGADSDSSLSDMLELVVHRFEMDWEQGKEPEIDDFLARAGAHRLPLLVELLHADMELRHEAANPLRVESYLKRYPELPEGEAARLVARDFELLASVAERPWSLPIISRASPSSGCN